MKKKSAIDRFPWWRLINDPRTWKAVDSLLESGLCEEAVVPLLREACAIPAPWAELHHETLKVRRDRRAKLAMLIRQTAYAIEQDPEARHFRVLGHDAVTTSVSNRPTIAGYLRDFSKLYEDRLNNSAEAKWLDGKGTTRMEYPEFVRREVARLLMRRVDNPRRSPIAAATELTNAILGADTATTGQLKQTFRHMRKKPTTTQSIEKPEKLSTAQACAVLGKPVHQKGVSGSTKSIVGQVAKMAGVHRNTARKHLKAQPVAKTKGV